ncbi:DUF4012 domain-containing protein [Demequina rhizosphaerae]|uniref:DUF4012 domain-containing protein n=1 Tax=Demequina rhizosphaerae TaxID=1638985 RepID=UPI0007866928|nr:DUF4012 domain-containing protein [Demequina rhizosphaerae]
MPRHEADASGKSRRRVWPWAVGIPALLVVALGAAFAWDAAHLLGAKDSLTAEASAAKRAIADRDAAALAESVSELETSAATFASSTDGPHWWIAAHTPWVADQATPLMEAGRAVDAIASEALAPLAEMGSLDALEVPGFEDGRIDPYVLEPYREPLAQAASALNEQGARLAATDLEGTLEAVRAPFLDLRAQMETVADLVQGAHVAAEVLPGMLGAEGERHYLVMVQNNAEPRTTGGIPGAVIELTVDDGRVSMGRYAPASSMVVQDGVGGLTDDELRIFSRRMEVYPHDVNFTPEYPRSAELLTRFWDAKYGDQVDGVLSVDPVALGWMLEGAPATAIGPFEITGENLAEVMLSESYLEFEDPREQDAFFAQASALLFARIVAGEGTALGGVERAIDAGRFMVWSGVGGEEELLATTPIAGGFLEREDALGIFINDGSGSKIGWYIDIDTQVTDHLCTDGSLAGQTVELTLVHTYDGDVEDLPEYVAGGWLEQAGEFHANLLVYPPVGTGVTKFTVDGERGLLSPEVHDGRTLAEARIVLKPGQSTTLRYEITSNRAGLLPSVVVETPGPKPNVYSRSADGLVDGC